MGRTLTDNFGLNYSIETSLGVAGTTWRSLEPNDISAFGATITTKERNPISNDRQDRKGCVTDLDSTLAFVTDVTRDATRDFVEGFVFATSINGDVSDLVTTAAETTTDSYAVTALTAAQADKFEIDTLLYATGFSIENNNGLKVVDADIVTSATAITVAENLTDEAVAPAAARVSFAGYEYSAATVVTWTWASGAKQATMNATGKGTILIALGLTAGQMVHIGSPDGSGGVQNAFENAAANDMFGYARVVSIAADDVIFDKVDAALQFTDATDPATAVDVLFGEFIRNVAVDDSDFLSQSFQFEGAFADLDTGPADMYEYAKGNFCNTMVINMPTADIATINYDFVGTDTEPPVVAGSRKTGASAAVAPTRNTAFCTSSDIARLRITDVDETGLTTDFKNITLTINNGVTAEKVLNVLGAQYLNTANFKVSLTSELVFTNSTVVNRIRDNTTVTMDVILKNTDGEAIAIDLPSMTLGDGAKAFPRNESVNINVSGQVFKDTTLLTSIGVSLFPIVP